jgi:hypothetical protein
MPDVTKLIEMDLEDHVHLAELLAQLEQAVAHHIREEQSEMLPKARAVLESDPIRDLGRQFEAAK